MGGNARKQQTGSAPNLQDSLWSSCQNGGHCSLNRFYNFLLLQSLVRVATPPYTKIYSRIYMRIRLLKAIKTVVELRECREMSTLASQISCIFYYFVLFIECSDHICH